jgi:hypothetical protein
MRHRSLGLRPLDLPYPEDPAVLAFLQNQAVTEILADWDVRFHVQLAAPREDSETAYYAPSPGENCSYPGCGTSSTNNCCEDGPDHLECCSNHSSHSKFCTGAGTCPYGGTYPRCNTAASCPSGSWNCENPNFSGTYGCCNAWSWLCLSMIGYNGDSWCYLNYDCRPPGSACGPSGDPEGVTCCDAGGSSGDCNDVGGGLYLCSY